MKNKKLGRPREYKYKGSKKITSIRLSEDERKRILNKFQSVQEFIQMAIEMLIK